IIPRRTPPSTATDEIFTTLVIVIVPRAMALKIIE
ncbi:unnamed protein product, partial [marine sediment metagenome]